MNPIEILLWGAAETLAKDICVEAMATGHVSERDNALLLAVQRVIEEAWAIEMTRIRVRIQVLPQSYA